MKHLRPGDMNEQRDEMDEQPTGCLKIVFIFLATVIVLIAMALIALA